MWNVGNCPRIVSILDGMDEHWAATNFFRWIYHLPWYPGCIWESGTERPKKKCSICHSGRLNIASCGSLYWKATIRVLWSWQGTSTVDRLLYYAAGTLFSKLRFVIWHEVTHRLINKSSVLLLFFFPSPTPPSFFQFRTQWNISGTRLQLPTKHYERLSREWTLWEII